MLIFKCWFGPVSDIKNLNRGMVSIVRYHIDIVSPDQKDYDGLHDMTWDNSYNDKDDNYEDSYGDKVFAVLPIIVYLCQ